MQLTQLFIHIIFALFILVLVYSFFYFKHKLFSIYSHSFFHSTNKKQFISQVKIWIDSLLITITILVLCIALLSFKLQLVFQSQLLYIVILILNTVSCTIIVFSHYSTALNKLLKIIITTVLISPMLLLLLLLVDSYDFKNKELNQEKFKTKIEYIVQGAVLPKKESNKTLPSIPKKRPSHSLIGLNDNLATQNSHKKNDSFTKAEVNIFFYLYVFIYIYFSLILIINYCTFKLRSKIIDNVKNINSDGVESLMQTVLNLIVFILSYGFVSQDVISITIFTGLLGAGLSIALRELVMNISSGIILIWDKSIKKGDVIELPDGSVGKIENIYLRYTELTDRDQTSTLIPNKILISREIINYSKDDLKVRLFVEIPIKLNLTSDEITVIDKLMQQSTRSCDRIVNKTQTRVFLDRHTDTASIFRIMFWISDPENGVANIKSTVMFAVYKSLIANNIQLPIPKNKISFESES